MKTTALNCALCNLFESVDENGSRFSNMKEAKTHARVHFDQVKMNDDDEEIDEAQMVERCFPKSQQKMDQDGSYRGGKSLVDLCNSLFGKRPNLSCINCNLCGIEMSIMVHGKFLRTDRIINHACVHASAKHFKCRRCENSFRSRSDVRYHLKHAHGAKLTDFDDQSARFYNEISNTIKRCFTDCKDGAPSKEKRDKTRDEIIARSRLKNGPSELAIQRQLFFNRSIKKNSNSEGKLKCRLCSRTVDTKAKVNRGRGGIFITERALHHAQCHLSKPLYRCLACHRSVSTYPAIVAHLQKKHALGMDKNHECFADKFHSDIMAVFAQCYEMGESAD